MLTFREVLVPLCKGIQKELQTSNLDKLTSARINRQIEQLLKSDDLDIDTNKPKIHRIISIQLDRYNHTRSLNRIAGLANSQKLNKTQRSGYIEAYLALLKTVYVDMRSPQSKYPDWLLQFIQSDKKVLLRDYWSLVKTSHAIDTLKKKPKATDFFHFNETYHKQLQETNSELLELKLGKTIDSELIRKIDLSHNSKNYLRPTGPTKQETKLCEPVKLLHRNLLHSPFINAKKSIPDFKTAFGPTTLGMPKVPRVQENLITKNLVKFQRWILQSSVLNTDDLKYLERTFHSIGGEKEVERLKKVAIKSFILKRFSILDDSSLHIPNFNDDNIK